MRPPGEIDLTTYGTMSGRSTTRSLFVLGFRHNENEFWCNCISDNTKKRWQSAIKVDIRVL